jgi:fibronectin-binding autotransporter adhesin
MSRFLHVVRGLVAGAVVAAAFLGHDTLAQSIALPGTLSGTQTWNAASGSATVTGNSTLSGTVTLGLGFEVEYLVVGGGGAGGGPDGNDAGFLFDIVSGGGGAGGFKEGTTMQTYGGGGVLLTQVMVGQGGRPGSAADNHPGSNGSPSWFGDATVDGGGRGARITSDSRWDLDATDGGSGGGGAGTYARGNATGNGIGHAGGIGRYTFPFFDSAGGGGGAGGPGWEGIGAQSGGQGGDGKASTISGMLKGYAGGGAGAVGRGGNEGGVGGGGSWSLSGSLDGAPNTGGGGAGSGNRYVSGAGGSGIVIARYLGPAFATGGEVTVGTGSATGYTLHTYTAVGLSSFDLPDLNTRLAATVSGNLSGTGGLRFTGPGVLTLSGSNSYTGPTTVSSGTLVAATPNSLPGYTAPDRVVFDGGALRVPLDGVSWTAAQVDELASNATKTSGTLAIDVPTGSQTLPSGIGGGIGLTKLGGGLLALTGNHSYTGLTTVSAGTLSIGNGGTAGSVAGNIVNGSSLIFNRSDAMTFSGTISGSGALTKLGDDTLTLTGNNSFTGPTRIVAGTLALGSVQALAGSTLDLAAGDTGVLALAVAGTATYSLGGLQGSRNLPIGDNSLSIGAGGASTTYSGAVDGSGGLVKTGAGTLTLAGSNSYTGLTTVSAGTLSIGDGGTSGSVAGNIANAATVVFNRSDASMFSGALSGAGAVTKAGAGTLTLTGSSSYSGRTSVTGGTLTLAGGSLGNGSADGTNRAINIGVSSGQTAALTVQSGTIAQGGSAGMVVGDAGTGTFNQTGGVVTLGAGGLYVGDGSSGVGTVNLSGGTFTSTGLPTILATRNRGTINVSGSAQVTLATLQFGHPVSTTSTSALNLDGGRLIVDQITRANGDASFSFNGGTLAARTNSTSFLSGLTRAEVKAGGAVIDTNGFAVTIAQNLTSSTSPPGGGLTKLGAGTLTLTGSNSFSGSTRVVSGTLLVSAASALAGSTLDLAADDAGTVSLQSGLERVNLGGLQGSRDLNLGGQALWVGGNGASTIYSGRLTGFGSLVKTGTGTLTLTGNSAITGLTTVSGGTLSIGSGGTTGAIGGDLVTDAEAVFNRSDDVTYAGNIQGTGAITKQGPGTLTLTNNNSYTGGTRLLGGTLALGDQRPLNALGGIGRTGLITFGGGTLRWETADTSGGFFPGIDYSPRFSTAANQAYSIDTNGRGVTFSANLSSAGGSLTKLGTGTLTLQSANSYTGATRVAAGTLALGDTQALAGSTLDLAAGDLGEVEFAVFANLGVNTYALGGLQGSRNLALGPNTLSIGEGGASTTYAGSLSGSGGLTKTGAGTLTLAGSNSYSGNTTVNGGTLLVAGGVLGTGSGGGTPLIYVGRTSGQTGVFTVESGTVAQGAASGLIVGDQGTGTFNQTGGSVTLGSGGFFLGNNAGGVGVANFSGGTFTNTAAGTVVATRNVGTINVSGSANVTLAGLQLGHSEGTNTTSTVNLDGGRLAVNRVTRQNGTANFFFNGGTLAARTNSGSFMTGLTRAEVKAGGAVIDTGSFAITIGQNLLASTSSPGGGLTKLGAGTLTLAGSNSYTGPTTVSAGTLQVADAGGLAATNVTVGTAGTLAIAAGTTMKSPAVIVEGGILSATTLAVNNTTGITSLAINAGTVAGSPAVTIADGGQMSLAQNARVSVGVGGLSVDQAPGGGRLDLGAGQVTIAAGGISAADLRADIIAGRNNGGWNGSTGIMSSAAAAAGGTRAVGYLISGDGSAQVSFAAAGDVDLSGQVNVFDLVSINSAGKYGSGAAAVWSQGDFNYDGVTNVFDLVGINTAAVYGKGNYFPAAPAATGSGVAAVPEPTAWMLTACGLAAIAAVRRRRG